MSLPRPATLTSTLLDASAHQIVLQGDSGLRYVVDGSSRCQTASSLLFTASRSDTTTVILKMSTPPDALDSQLSNQGGPCGCSLTRQSVVHELQIHSILQEHIRSHHNPTLLETIVAPIDTICGSLVQLFAVGNNGDSYNPQQFISSTGSITSNGNSDIFEGKDLALVFQKCTPLQTSTITPKLQMLQIMDLANDILTALAAIHDAGVVHCDISVCNIVIDNRSTITTNNGDSEINTLSRPRYCLIDFGLAQSFCEAESSPAAFGTPGYIAPEVLTPPFSPIPMSLGNNLLRGGSNALTPPISSSSSWSSATSLSSLFNNSRCETNCHRITPTTARDIYGFGIVLGLLLSHYLPLCKAELLGSASCNAHYVHKNIEPRLKTFKSVLHSLGMAETAIYHAADLLIRMLSYSPRTRISAAGALLHPFVLYTSAHPVAENTSKFWTIDYALEHWKSSDKYAMVRNKMNERKHEWENCDNDNNNNDEQHQLTQQSHSEMNPIISYTDRQYTTSQPHWPILSRLYNNSSNNIPNRLYPTENPSTSSDTNYGSTIIVQTIRTVGFEPTTDASISIPIINITASLTASLNFGRRTSIENIGDVAVCSSLLIERSCSTGALNSTNNTYSTSTRSSEMVPI